MIKIITVVIYDERFQPSLVFRDKHSSLLPKTVNYDHNKFYDAVPRVDPSGAPNSAPLSGLSHNY
jgi:hypothetical protein